MPTSLTPYQSNKYIKNINSKNLFQKGKSMLLEKDVSQFRKERIKDWVTFYRSNISYFVEHYMNTPLYPYQKYWLNLISMSTNFLGIASRASAKSWIIACYSIARCILYPGTIVSLNSSTKAQAGLIISQHCQSIHNGSLNVQRETLSLVVNNNKWEMAFLNSSKILVVISGEAGRGNRSHVSVLEERRLIPTLVIDSIIRPFLVSRQPPFMKNPKYMDMVQEEPQEIIITSSYFKSHDWWAEAKKLLKMILNDDPDVKAIFLDYLITLKHGIKTKKQLQKEREKMDEISFLMEYGNIPYSSATSSFLKIGFFNRNLNVSWKPLKDDFTKKNVYDIPRDPHEIRLVSVDVAMRKGASNDNTIITCARLFPTKKGWMTDICYIESHNGKNALIQSLRIKQIYYEFTGSTKGDMLILDIAGSGITVYDALTSVTKDDIRGKEYDAMKVMRHPTIDDKLYDELTERSLSQEAIDCIYPISASQQLNSQIAFAFRDRLKRKLLRFLVDENEAEDFLIRKGNKDILDQNDSSIRAYLLSAYVQTTLMINECISLEMSVLGQGVIKLQEASSGRKDRFTSVSYLNWMVSLMDIELLKEDGNEDEWDTIRNITMVV